MNTLKVKKLDKNATLPFYATKGAAAFDICTIDHAIVGVLPKIYHTGLAFEIPQNQVMLLFSRSGHGFAQDIRLSNCVGVIDEDYRGELKVKLKADGAHIKEFRPGDKIAQAIILPIERFNIEWAEELSNTERGVNGFGSTG